jgi:flagellar hook-associated protein 3 FlgL
MISRVTSTTQMRSAQANLQASAQRLAQLQEQSSSLKTMSRASDDPSRAANALAVRAEQRATVQYTSNADNADGWLTTLDNALGSSTNILTKVRDLAVQGANSGSMTPATREAIAAQIDGLKKDLLKEANATYLGRAVFAGNSDAKSAFTPEGTYVSGSTDGVTAVAVERRVSADSTIRVDADGGAVFGSVFKLLTDISTALRADPALSVSPHLADLDKRITSIIGARAEVGARQARVETATASLVTQKGTLEAQRVQLEDVDLATVILDLKLQEIAYQSALAVTARVLQPTLMDFLS